MALKPFAKALLAGAFLFQTNLFASDTDGDLSKMPSLLSMQNISLEDPETWPHKQDIEVDMGGVTPTLRLDFDNEHQGLNVWLQGKNFGDTVKDLEEKYIKPNQPIQIDKTYVINGHPTFVKLMIDSTEAYPYKVNIERLSSPYSIAMLVRIQNKVFLQNGVDQTTFGLIESRDGSIFIGMNPSAPLCEFGVIPPTTAPHFSFGTIDNEWGALFAPKGKIVMAAVEGRIINGRAIQLGGKTTTVLSALGHNVPINHKFYQGGNGSFMFSKQELQLYAHCIQNNYNKLLSNFDIWLGYFESTIKHKGYLKAGRNLWVGARSLDLTQDRETPYVEVRGKLGSCLNAVVLSGHIGEVSLSDHYPEAEIGGDVYMNCDDVYTNHPVDWTSVFRWKGQGYHQGYNGQGLMKIHRAPRFVLKNPVPIEEGQDSKENQNRPSFMSEGLFKKLS